MITNQKGWKACRCSSVIFWLKSKRIAGLIVAFTRHPTLSHQFLIHYSCFAHLSTGSFCVTYFWHRSKPFWLYIFTFNFSHRFGTRFFGICASTSITVIFMGQRTWMFKSVFLWTYISTFRSWILISSWWEWRYSTSHGHTNMNLLWWAQCLLSCWHNHL